MAQVDQVDNSDNSDVVDFTVFGVELPRLSAYAQDVYGCLLNNGMYMFQPNCKMDLPLVKAALGCYYPTVSISVYSESTGGFHWYQYWKGAH